MNRLQSIFNRHRVLLPVIHAINPAQCYAQAQLCFAAGADGLFFINQGGMEPRTMLALAEDVARMTPHERFLVGVNLLGASPEFTIGAMSAMGGALRMLWTDAADARASTLFTDGEHQPGVLPRLCFGGVAFKGQRDAGLGAQEAALAAAHEAALGLDVVTTSGPGTGQPVASSKVKAMRIALGDLPLAVASGVDFDLVHELLPYVDAYLVASSLESRFGYFDKGRVQALADRIHAWQPVED